MSDASSEPVRRESAATHEKSAPKKLWGPFTAVFYALIPAFLGSQIIGGLFVGLVGMLIGLDQSEINSWSRTIGGQFVFYALIESLMFAIILAYVLKRGYGIGQVGLDGFRWNYITKAVAGYLSYMGLYILVITVVSSFLPSLDLQQKQIIGFDNPSGAAQLLMVFASLVLLPPVAEEVVFRGFMFGGLRSKLNFLTSAIITSLIFAVGHLQFGNDNNAPLLWVAGIDTFILSMVLCYIRDKTGSIWPTILIHMMKNGLAFTILYVIKA